MNRIGLRAVLPVLMAAGLTASAGAHHSNAMFDQTKTVTLRGTVKAFQWTNPHCYIQMVAADGGQEWSLEMGAPFYLQNRGWKPRSLKPGDAIAVTFSPLRSGKRGGLVFEVVRGDGSPVATQ